MEKEILEFASLIIKNVRDRAIHNCDVTLNGTNMHSPIIKRWKETMSQGDLLKFGEMIIPDCIDDALFYFFDAVDNGIINLSFTNAEGKIINLNSNGELAGWYMGEWRYELSKERCDEDLNDIN